MLQESELRGEGGRKTRVGAAKFKSDFDQLSRELASLNLDDSPTPELLVVGFPCEVVDDLENEAKEEEECESANIENNKEDKDEEDVDDELIKISLTEAKHYAKALHHFVIDNLNQSQLIEFADSSYRLAQIVDCGTKVQKDLLSYFRVQNNDA